MEHTPEAIAAWADSMRQRYRGQPVAICLEADKGLLVYALREYDFFVLFPVNPLTLSRFREAFATSGARDALVPQLMSYSLLQQAPIRLICSDNVDSWFFCPTNSPHDS